MVNAKSPILILLAPPSILDEMVVILAGPGAQHSGSGRTEAGAWCVYEHWEEGQQDGIRGVGGRRMMMPLLGRGRNYERWLL